MAWLIIELLNKLLGSTRKCRSLLNGVKVSSVELMNTKSSVVGVNSSSPYMLTIGRVWSISCVRSQLRQQHHLARSYQVLQGTSPQHFLKIKNNKIKYYLIIGSGEGLWTASCQDAFSLFPQLLHLHTLLSPLQKEKKGLNDLQQFEDTACLPPSFGLSLSTPLTVNFPINFKG